MRIRLGVLCLLLTATTASAQSLEQQAICAKQAKVAYDEMNAAAKTATYKPSGDYESHYNTKLNKCFVAYGNMDVVNGKYFISEELFDAFEGRVYASYGAITAGGQTGVHTCDLTPTRQTQTHCSSKGEYDAFVAKYMEE